MLNGRKTAARCSGAKGPARAVTAARHLLRSTDPAL